MFNRIKLKVTVQDQIETQIDDALFQLHQSRMSAQYHLNQIKYLEEKLETLQSEKEFYAKIYSSGKRIDVANPNSTAGPGRQPAAKA